MQNVKQYVSVQTCTLLFALSALISERVSADIMTIVFGRGLFSMLLLTGVMAFRHGLPWKNMRACDLSRLVMNGALLGLHWFCFFMGVREGGVAIGTLGFACFPAFVMLFEALFYREKLSFTDMTVITLIVAGLLILSPGLVSAGGVSSGMIWGLAGGLSYAVIVMVNRHVRTAASSLQASWAQCLGCMLIALPAGAPGLLKTPVSELWLIIILGVVCTGLAYTLLTYGLRQLQAKTAAVVIAMEPVYVIALAWLLLSQTPDVRTLLGAGLITFAAFISSRAQSQTAEA
ncbi:TPA: DMT family transporter [Klebsiella pneumoniae]|nr:DMT family transporter [Klebsiella pneumoniae]